MAGFKLDHGFFVAALGRPLTGLAGTGNSFLGRGGVDGNNVEAVELFNQLSGLDFGRMMVDSEGEPIKSGGGVTFFGETGFD